MGKEKRKYDDKNNLIYYRRYNDYKCWKEDDEDNNLIYYKNTSGLEWWAKYDELKNKIDITKQEYNEIKFRGKGKKYLNRVEIDRFELIDLEL